MSRTAFLSAISPPLPRPLSELLVDSFLDLKREAQARTTPNSATPGKFIEYFVHALQFLESGSCEQALKVDEYLRALESRPTQLDEGLRLCSSRIARSVYTLRNKRNIAHIGRVDSNTYDRIFIFHSAQWLMAELVRCVTRVSMSESGALIEQITAPVTPAIDSNSDRPLVLGDFSATEEATVLLRHAHPGPMTMRQLLRSMDRRDGSTVRRAVRSLWKAKHVDGEPAAGYRLTPTGLASAEALLARPRD